MLNRLKKILWIFLVDTYVIILSFALLKVLELMLKSFWQKEIGLLKIMDLTFNLPILLAYIFLLSFDLSEYFLRKGQ